VREGDRGGELGGTGVAAAVSREGARAISKKKERKG